MTLIKYILIHFSKEISKMKTLITTILLVLAINQASAYWEATNGPQSTTIRALVYHNDILFAGSSHNNAIYKFNKSTQKWILSNTGLPKEINGINDFLSYDNKLFVITNSGVYLSTNNGEYWESQNNGLTEFRIVSICLYEDNILIATSASTYLFDFEQEVWLPLGKKVSNTMNYTIGTMHVDSTSIYLGTSEGLYVSYDTGDSWDELELPASFDKSIRLIYTNNDYIFIATQKYLLKSTDKGLSWFNISPFDENIYTGVVLFDSQVFISTSVDGLFHSNDMGLTWEQVRNGLNYDRINCIHYLNNEFFVGTNGLGIFKSEDNGISWNSFNSGFLDSVVLNLLESENKIIANAFSLGVMVSVDNGINWETLFENQNITEFSYLCNCNNIVYANSFMTTKVFYADLGLENWIEIQGSINDLRILQLECINNALMIVTNNSIYELSQDENSLKKIWDNDDWKSVNTELSNMSIQTNVILGFSDKLIAGTFRGIFVSDNNGSSWNEFDKELRNYRIHRLQKDGELIYGLVEDISNQPAVRKIIVMNVETNTWSIIELGVSNTIRNIYILQGHIFIDVQNDGLMLSQDNGVNWQNVNIGLPETSYYGLLNNEEYLFLATGGQGVWRAKLIDFGIEVSVAENEIETYNYLYAYPPYPVPARSEVQTKIYFDSSKDIAIENMAVYDIYGRKLPTKESLRFEQDTFYSGNIIWDCSAVEPGVYIIRINHGTEVRAVKVMVGM